MMMMLMGVMKMKITMPTVWMRKCVSATRGPDEYDDDDDDGGYDNYDG